MKDVNYITTEELNEIKRKSVEKLGKRAKVACYDYNQLSPDRVEERTELIKKIFGKTSDNICVESPFFCEVGENIEVGNNFFSNCNVQILDSDKVTFGDNVLIGPNSAFYTVGHPLDAKRRNEGWFYTKPIEIGNNVWIGGNVVVLAGVKIGDNSVIGAGSVVTKDIPSNVIAVGNPCKVLRKIEE